MRADQKLDPDARRELLLRALSGENRTYLVHEYPISRTRLYQLLEEVKSDPEKAVKRAEEKANDARKELEFRRRVLEIIEDNPTARLNALHRREEALLDELEKVRQEIARVAKEEM